MKCFFDTSALVKRYVAEKDSPFVSSKLREADDVIISSLCLIEVTSTMSRLLREKRLDSADYRLIKTGFQEDLAWMTVIGVNEEVVNKSISIVEKHPLRAIDSIHLSSAVLARADLFVSADKRQCEAGEKLGLNVFRLD